MANIIWDLQNLRIQNKTFFFSIMAHIFFGIHKIYEFKFYSFYRYYMDITGMYYFLDMRKNLFHIIYQLFLYNKNNVFNFTNLYPSFVLAIFLDN